MKRIIGLLIFMLVTVSFVMAGTVTVFADDEFSLIVSSEKVKKGTDTVTVDISMKNNPGVAGISMNLEFDNTALAVKNVESGSYSSLSLVAGQGTQSPYKIILVNFAGADVDGDGKLVSVTFDIIEGTPTGTYDIHIKCNHEEDDVFIIDQTGEHIDNTAVSGKVTIVSDKPSGGGFGGGSVGSSKEDEAEDDDKSQTEDTVTKDNEDKTEGVLSPEKWTNPFSDVKEDDWFYASVEYAVNKGLFNGVSESEFAPSMTLTREMLVTVLYRAEGEPEVKTAHEFTDVAEDAYYAKAVAWGKESGIVNGMSVTEFAPDLAITREQIGTIMFRYAVYKGMLAVTLEENLGFDDADQISEYAVSALNWAVGCGLIKGRTETTINPKDTATRAEAATILTRYFTEVAVDTQTAEQE